VRDQPFVVDQAPQLPRPRAASLIGPRRVRRPRVEVGFRNNGAPGARLSAGEVIGVRALTHQPTRPVGIHHTFAIGLNGSRG
jgi:hypothetical protein